MRIASWARYWLLLLLRFRTVDFNSSSAVSRRIVGGDVFFVEVRSVGGLLFVVGRGSRSGRMMSEAMECLPIRRRCWFRQEREEVRVEGNLISGDEDLGAIGNTVAEDLLVACNADEDALGGP